MTCRTVTPNSLCNSLQCSGLPAEVWLANGGQGVGENVIIGKVVGMIVVVSSPPLIMHKKMPLLGVDFHTHTHTHTDIICFPETLSPLEPKAHFLKIGGGGRTHVKNFVANFV